MEVLKYETGSLTEAIREFGFLFDKVDCKSFLVTPNRRPMSEFYTDPKQPVRLAKMLSIMTDFKAGVPRCGYKGIVQTQLGDIRVFPTLKILDTGSIRRSGDHQRFTSITAREMSPFQNLCQEFYPEVLALSFDLLRIGHSPVK